MTGRTIPIASLILAGLLTLPLVVSSLTHGASVNHPARIEVTREGDALHVRGVFEAVRPFSDELRYQLDVTKRGTSGNSTTRQGGTFMPTPGQADTLSTVQVGVQPGDTVVARLEVTGPAGPVATADFRDTIR